MHDYQLEKAKQLEHDINKLYELNDIFNRYPIIFKKRIGFRKKDDEVYLGSLREDVMKEIITAVKNVIDKKLSELEDEFKNL